MKTKQTVVALLASLLLATVAYAQTPVKLIVEIDQKRINDYRLFFIVEGENGFSFIQPKIVSDTMFLDACQDFERVSICIEVNRAVFVVEGACTVTNKSHDMQIRIFQKSIEGWYQKGAFCSFSYPDGQMGWNRICTYRKEKNLRSVLEKYL